MLETSLSKKPITKITSGMARFIPVFAVAPSTFGPGVDANTESEATAAAEVPESFNAGLDLDFAGALAVGCQPPTGRMD